VAGAALNGPGDCEGGTLATPSLTASVLPRWQALLAGAIRSVDELWRVLDLPEAAKPGGQEGAALFPVLVPRGFAALMRRGDMSDPLLRQVLPVAAEGDDAPGFAVDPLHEDAAAVVPGLLHKYQGRALLVTTGACAVHCRYCFRRHFAYDDLPRGRRWWDAAVAAVAADPTLSEVLLSGGDPLTLPDGQLAALVADLAAIPHLTRLRVHSRLPVVLPERVDDSLLSWLTGSRLRPVLVIHANHPQELSPAVLTACRRLREAGVTVLNQAVLLAGINDHADTLTALSESLFAAGVLPYYLHQLDRVAGAAHFSVADARAIALVDEVAARLPGYLVPRLVREEPGGRGKSPLR